LESGHTDPAELRQRDLRGADGESVRGRAALRRRGRRLRRLFLEDVRAYREGRLAAAGKRGLFPLWGHDTAALAREFLAAGFEATLICPNLRALDPAFARRRYGERLLAELPPGVDPRGENGEFHTFVSAGPIFAEPIADEPGEIVERHGFVFCDLTPA
jgi:diphthamide synthase (EF-2-diphthine--ammonia ligase)